MDPEIPPGYVSVGEWPCAVILRCSFEVPLFVWVQDGVFEAFVPLEKERWALDVLGDSGEDA